MSELQPKLQDLEQIDKKLGLRHGVVSINDEIDFADLYTLDDGWESLRNGVTADIETMETEAEIAKYTERLKDPRVPQHMLGYLYFSTLNDREGWVSLGSTMLRWLDGKHNKLSRSVGGKIIDLYGELVDEGIVERKFTSYRLHKDYDPSYDFPDYSDDFEEVITPMLRKRPLGVRAAFVVQMYFQETGHKVTEVTPYEYWAGRYELTKLHQAGIVDAEDNNYWLTTYQEPEPEVPEEDKIAQNSLDDSIAIRTKGLVVGPEDMSEDFEMKLKHANITGRTRLRKPMQRGRWK